MRPATPTPDETPPPRPRRPPAGRGYGRARLWLGITGVGLWVLVSVALLITDAAAAARTHLPAGVAGDVLLIGGLLMLFVAAQLPLDGLGGHRVPEAFGRRIYPAPQYPRVLVRGIAVHASLLGASAAILYAGGAAGGLLGAWVAGLGWIGLLAAARGAIARGVASLPTQAPPDSPKPAGPTDPQAEPAALPVAWTASADEGFTGGITGLFRPHTHVVPAGWATRLTPEQFALTMARRGEVARSGAWRFGRVTALTFTAGGLAFALAMAGDAAAGSGVGVVETSLWFTLWSFGGLLTLPTLSRAAVRRVDQRLLARGLDPGRLDAVVAELDRMQDDEPQRSRWIERVFHPVPSVANRRLPPPAAPGLCWDVARTSVYLGIAGVSLLTRSVHCNVGRPALWVWLPSD